MSTFTVDLNTLTATNAARAIHEGQLSAEALVAASLARIERFNPTINALITRNPAALEQAREADRRRLANQATLPLDGIPASIKDVFATRDMVTTASYAPLANYRPDRDATVVARLRDAGAIFMGKSNLPELAGAPHCWSPLFGLTRNPWNPDLTPGGSSGGSAAAIACGFSLMELGSDLAGSIRIPAAYCGVTGLKATENRIPRTGHIPHLPPHVAGGKTGRSVWHLLSLGVLARSVADLRLSYALIAGPDGVDTTVPPFFPARPATPQPDRPLRIALWDDFAGTPLCLRTRNAIERTALALSKAGHHVVRCPAPIDVEAAWHAFGMIAGAEVGLGMPRWQRNFLLTARHLLPKHSTVTRAITAGLGFDLRKYNEALNRKEALSAQLDTFLADYDGLLCPVAPTAPYPGRPMNPLAKPPFLEIAGQRVLYFEATISLTTPFSLTGHPVLALPAGIEDGLPIGLQLVGKRWQEHDLLTIGAQLEPALGGFTPPPYVGS
ncbi:MAG TPA: amidase [Rhodocyclaceae bacterium]|nr:amidase [Rhodocyclaceae bacterium]